MRIEEDVKLDFEDVLIKPKRSEVGSRHDVNLEREFKTRNSKQLLKCIPIIGSNMDCVGTVNMAYELAVRGLNTCLHKFHSEEKIIECLNTLRGNGVFYTTGIIDKDIEKLKNIAKRTQFLKNICIDAANGYTKYFVDKVRQVREAFPHSIIMAGNVATGDMTQELILNGADIVKIGIGPGKVCETRKVTGVGYYQLSAIIECADTAHGVGGHICADGGCVSSGDICKAFGAGADFVMLGTMLAGHDECEGQWTYETHFDQTMCHYPYEPVYTDKKKSLKVYGMSSREAMEKYYGGIAEHRAPEGKCIEIPYKGPVANTIKDILGGLRSSCAYIGTDDIKHFSKCTTFIKSK